MSSRPVSPSGMPPPAGVRLCCGLRRIYECRRRWLTAGEAGRAELSRRSRPGGADAVHKQAIGRETEERKGQLHPEVAHGPGRPRQAGADEVDAEEGGRV